MSSGKTAVTRDVEASIERLKAVDVARIVTDDSECPTEVHVMSDGSKPPKQLVRDIQSVALALHDLELDHRMISVVAIPGSRVLQPTVAAACPGVLALEGIGVHTSAERVTVHVALSGLGREGEGVAVGPSDPGCRCRLVAAATCQAVERLYGAPNALRLEGVESVSVGGVHVVVVVATAVGPASAVRLTGSAPGTAGSPDEGVVRAVLDATNDRLASVFEVGSTPARDEATG